MSIYIAEIIRIFIGFILLSAAWGKTKTFAEFTSSLAASFNLSNKISLFLSPIIILIEFILAFSLLSKLSDTHVLMFISLALFSLFACIICFLLVKDKVVSCNCFGEEKQPISSLDLIRNFIFISAICIYLFVSYPEKELSNNILILLASVSVILTILSINFNKIIMVLTLSNQGHH